MENDPLLVSGHGLIGSGHIHGALRVRQGSRSRHARLPQRTQSAAVVVQEPDHAIGNVPTHTATVCIRIRTSREEEFRGIAGVVGRAVHFESEPLVGTRRRRGGRG